MSDTSQSEALLNLLKQGSSTYSTQASLINQPTADEVKAQGLVDLGAGMAKNTNPIASGISGFLQGYGTIKKGKAAEARDNKTNFLLAQLQHQQQLSDWADHVRENAGVAAAAKQEIMDAGPQLATAVDAYQKSGDVQSLSNTIRAMPGFTEQLRRQVDAPQGSQFAGLVADNNGQSPTLHAAFVTPDGQKLVSPQGFTNEDINMQLIKPFADAKALTQLQMDTKVADLAKTQAETKLAEGKVDGTVKAPPKPLPASVTKLQNDELTAIGNLKGVNADVATLNQLIDSGKLHTDLLSRGSAAVRTTFNNSDENTRNLAQLDSTLESLRNKVLLLNKGVQTEGDATRAMNEIIKNKNDTAIVKEQLQRLQAINDRAVTLRQAGIDQVRSDYNQEPIDYSKYTEQPSAIQGAPDQNKAAQIKAAFKAGQIDRITAEAQLKAIGFQ